MTTITKGEGLSALMDGYWKAQAELGPMPIWHTIGDAGRGRAIPPFQRLADDAETPEAIQRKIAELLRQEQALASRRQTFEMQLQEIIGRKGRGE